MKNDPIDTICALSTPPGRAALALIRISGSKSHSILEEMAGKKIKVREPSLCVLKSKEGRVLDEAVVCLFQGPASFTGEDMAEISCHGNPVIVEEILRDIVSRETRLAEAGEFTRRALANEKISLSDVEAVDWILNSRSFLAAERGLQSKIGGLSESAGRVLEDLTNLNVLIESQLDFSEQETGSASPKEMAEVIGRLKSTLNSWISTYDHSKSLLNSWTVVLAGPPNSGKSSLFNALIGGEKAIVYDQPGTTRDFLEHHFELGGQSIVLVDTAGIRDRPDPIEKLGIERSLKIMGAADLICWVDDSSEAPAALKDRFQSKNWISIRSKADLLKLKPASGGIYVSAKTGEGLKELGEIIFPEGRQPGSEGSAPLTSDRQRLLVAESLELLNSMEALVLDGALLDQAADLLRKLTRKLEDLSGGVPTNDLLREIFKRFCIGK